MQNHFKFLKSQVSVFIVIFTVSLFLVLPQILNHSLVLASDSLFHFNRIYDIYMQFKTGNFSYFQTNYGFQQSGRIVNALYGPGLAYFLGGLLLIVHSWIKFQVITSFLLFFVSGYSMYSLSREMSSTRKISLLVSILFMSSYWVTRWSAEQNFMAWGTAIVPLIVLMGIKMIKDDGNDLHVLPLALIVSLLIQVHILSALMSVIILIVFFIIGFFQTNHKLRLSLTCFLAGLLTLILTFNVWGAMLDVFTTNKIYPTYANLHMSNSTMNISTGNFTITQIGLIMSLLFVLQICYLFFQKKDLTLLNRTITILGLFFLILTSNLIPWTRVGIVIPELQHYLQFPRRFEGFASVLLLAGFGSTLSTFSTKKFRPYFELLLIVGSVFVTIQSYTEIQQRNEIWHSAHSILSKQTIVGHSSNERIVKSFTGPDLGSGLNLVTNGTPDYLPNNRTLSTQPYIDFEKDINLNKSIVSKTVNKNGDLTLFWFAAKKGSPISLPVVIYNNSTVKLNDSNLNPKRIILSNMGTPTVQSSKMGTNTLTLSYHSRIITKISLLVVITTWILSLFALIFSCYPIKNKWLIFRDSFR